MLHPPIQRFLGRWQPGDPVAYLGALLGPLAVQPNERMGLPVIRVDEPPPDVEAGLLERAHRRDVSDVGVGDA